MLIYRVKFMFAFMFLLVILITTFNQLPSKIPPTSIAHQVKSPEYLPIIYQPKEDSKKLVALYYCSFPNSNLTEITLVFTGEDHPNWFINKIYTPFRVLRYHRIEDIETFYLKTNEEGKLQEIIFSHKGIGTYANKQTYNTLNPKHCVGQIPYSEFEWSDDRPHIYVNTWNHLFGEKNNNPELSYTIRKNHPLLIGTREKAESDFKLCSVVLI